MAGIAMCRCPLGLGRENEKEGGWVGGDG
uniref:Uncharacterized protein n=1 Tax=Oryza sativa subsp. japonica TaxID=39947 RepID=Q337U1_ORYSJ|nr:hypothetical protein LOC_Os10g30399 [Oryza sativa Japonica Group]